MRRRNRDVGCQINSYTSWIKTFVARPWVSAYWKFLYWNAIFKGVSNIWLESINKCWNIHLHILVPNVFYTKWPKQKQFYSQLFLQFKVSEISELDSIWMIGNEVNESQMLNRSCTLNLAIIICLFPKSCSKLQM